MENWNRILPETMPHPNQRVLVSDGETTAIAQYCIDHDSVVWLFDNPSLKDITLTWWQELPDEPPKVQTVSNELL